MILYHIILYHIILYYVMLYYIIWYGIVSFCIVLYEYSKTVEPPILFGKNRNRRSILFDVSLTGDVFQRVPGGRLLPRTAEKTQLLVLLSLTEVENQGIYGDFIRFSWG